MKCPTCKGLRTVQWDFSETFGYRDIQTIPCPNKKCVDGEIEDTRRRKGEAGMSEKLTRNELHGYACDIWGGGTANVPDEDAEINLWARIEADREAIREETRTELLKDHFKIEEPIEFEDGYTGAWRGGYVAVFMSLTQGKPPFTPIKVRRPSKKRPMTDGEMLAKLIYRLETWDAVEGALKHGKTLEELCVDRGIPVEIEE